MRIFLLLICMAMTCEVMAVGGSASQADEIRKPDLRISREFPQPIISVAFDPNGKFLAVLYRDRTVRVYDVQLDGQSLPKRSYQFGEDRYKVVAVGFSGANMLALVGADRRVRIWDIIAGNGVQKVELRSGENFGDKMVTTFAPSRWSLLAGAAAKDITVWNFQTGEVITNFVTNDSDVSGMAFTPDKKSLVIGTWKGVVRVVDVASWKVTRMIDLDSPIHSLAAATNGIALGYEDGTVAMLKFGEPSSVPEVKKQGGAINAVAFSADGKRFASASADGTVKVWDVETMKVLWLLEGKGGAETCVAFSPDGREMVAGDEKGDVCCWILPTARLFIRR